MVFEQIPIGGDRNFAYIVGDEEAKEAAAIDVGYNPQMIFERLKAQDMILRYMIGTHPHYDHVDGFEELQAMTGAPLVMHEDVPHVSMPLDDGQELKVGQVAMRVIHCPGHSAESIALLVDGRKLISGDELFVGKVGGTSTREQAEQQYHSLHEKLMTLDDDVEVWPGHDVGVSPSSTIGHERRTNPFLLCKTFDQFLWLKENWAQYKREHGIA
jgi:glyoxylase-like metal-dependent hydrolase (beta-lactamase superfamily II)